MDMKSISQKLQDDIRAIMEAGLHPNQQKIDVHEPEKDEITAHDFKKLRAMKKDKTGKITKEDTDDQIQELAGKAAQQAAIAISLIKAGKKDGKMPKPMKEEEEKKKPVSPFDYKNYTSQIPKKPGELTGHDSKKTSTGTVYTKKPVKEEIEELDELSKSTLGSYAKKAKGEMGLSAMAAGAQSARGDAVGRAIDMAHAKKRSKGLDKAITRLTKEEVELGEAKSLHKMSAGELDQAHKDNEAKIAAIHKNDPSKRITMSHPLISKRRSINLHKIIRSKQSNEEVELDEGSGPKEKQKTPFRNINGPEYKAAADKQRQQMAKDKAAEPGKKMMAKPMKEDSVPSEYTFADYLEAARAQYVDEDAVLVANEAFKNQDITLFSDQSQSSEA